MVVHESPVPTHPLEAPARWAAVAATLCGIHCLVTPVLVATLPFLAVSKGFEWGALGLTVALGVGVTLLGPARRRSSVLAVLALGAATWAGALVGVFEPLPESVPSAAGSLIFAGGMIWSARICRSGACERCEA